MTFSYERQTPRKIPLIEVQSGDVECDGYMDEDTDWIVYHSVTPFPGNPDVCDVVYDSHYADPKTEDKFGEVTRWRSDTSINVNGRAYYRIKEEDEPW